MTRRSMKIFGAIWMLIFIAMFVITGMKWRPIAPPFADVESFTVHQDELRPISNKQRSMRPPLRASIENYIDHLSQIHRKYAGNGFGREEKNAMVEDTLDMLRMAQ